MKHASVQEGPRILCQYNLPHVVDFKKFDIWQGWTLHEDHSRQFNLLWDRNVETGQCTVSLIRNHDPSFVPKISLDWDMPVQTRRYVV